MFPDLLTIYVINRRYMMKITRNYLRSLILESLQEVAPPQPTAPTQEIKINDNLKRTIIEILKGFEDMSQEYRNYSADSTASLLANHACRADPQLPPNSKYEIKKARLQQVFDKLGLSNLQGNQLINALSREQ